MASRSSVSALEDKLKLHTIPRLLIIDEIGYLLMDRDQLVIPISAAHPSRWQGIRQVPVSIVQHESGTIGLT